MRVGKLHLDAWHWLHDQVVIRKVLKLFPKLPPDVELSWLGRHRLKPSLSPPYVLRAHLVEELAPPVDDPCGLKVV